MNPRYTKKQLVIIITTVIIMVGLVALGLFGIIRDLTKNPYGDSTTIGNYSQKITTLPDDYRDLFTATLYDMIKLNYSGDKPIPSINDALIRDDSNKETVSTKGRHAGSFIVDIASIEQSYLVQYEYSSNPSDAFMSGYPILISCLDEDQLTYKPFACKEMYSDGFETFDPIFDIVPYATLNYQIDASKGADNTTALTIELYLTEADKDNKESVVATYKNEALMWLRSKGFDPSDYKITYLY